MGRAWATQTPDDFLFAVQGGRFITHLKPLRDVRAPLREHGVVAGSAGTWPRFDNGEGGHAPFDATALARRLTGG